MSKFLPGSAAFTEDEFKAMADKAFDGREVLTEDEVKIKKKLDKKAKDEADEKRRKFAFHSSFFTDLQTVLKKLCLPLSASLIVMTMVLDGNAELSVKDLSLMLGTTPGELESGAMALRGKGLAGYRHGVITLLKPEFLVLVDTVKQLKLIF